MKARCLEQYRYRTEFDYLIDLRSIEAHDLSVLVLNIGAGYKRSAMAESLPRPPQHIKSFRIAKKIHVPSVHVDSVHQTRTVGSYHMLLE
jgi:hypothetical protein